MLYSNSDAVVVAGFSLNTIQKQGFGAGRIDSGFSSVGQHNSFVVKICEIKG
jgi:hypothetical protein